MKILVSLYGDQYERMLNGIERESQLNSILMDGVALFEGEGVTRKKAVRFLCEKPEAEMIRDATRTFCPEATAEIDRRIARATDPR
jgi:hypothetical protein